MDLLSPDGWPSETAVSRVNTAKNNKHAENKAQLEKAITLMSVN